MKRYLISFVTIIGFAISGCATGLEITAEENNSIVSECAGVEDCIQTTRVALTERKKEEREYKRQVREDLRIEEWRATVAWCADRPGMSMWYSSRGIVSVRARRTGIPDRGTSYGCDYTAATIRTLQRGF